MIQDSEYLKNPEFESCWILARQEDPKGMPAGWARFKMFAALSHQDYLGPKIWSIQLAHIPHNPLIQENPAVWFSLEMDHILSKGIDYSIEGARDSQTISTRMYSSLVCSELERSIESKPFEILLKDFKKNWEALSSL
jgi:hypothetical protein